MTIRAGFCTNIINNIAFKKIPSILKRLEGRAGGLPLFISLILLLFFAPAVLLLGRGTPEESWEEVTGTNNWRHEIDISDKEPGLYNIVIKGTDFAGNVYTEGPFDIRIDPDSDLPITRVMYPEEGTVVRGNVDILGTAVDDDAVERVEVRVNDGPFQAAQGTEYWRHIINSDDLEDGIHTITVRAFDIKGLEGPEYSTEFILDTQPPIIEITSHESGAIVNGRVSFTGTAIDANGIDELSLSRDGGETYESLRYRQARGEGQEHIHTFSIDVRTTRLKDGPYIYWIRAIDGTGAKAETPFLFFADNESPEVTILAPEAQSPAHGLAQISGSIRDAVGIERFWYEWDDQEHTIELVPGNPYWSVEIDLREHSGRWADINFFARDTSGNQTHLRHRLANDREGAVPRVVITAPTSLEERPDLSPKTVITGHISGVHRGETLLVSGYEDGEVREFPAYPHFTLPLTELPPGRIDLRLRARDELGMEGPETRVRFTRKALPPKVELIRLVYKDGTEEPFVPGMEYDRLREATLHGRILTKGSVSDVTALVSPVADLSPPEQGAGAAPRVRTERGEEPNETLFYFQLPERTEKSGLFENALITLTVEDNFGTASTLTGFIHYRDTRRIETGPRIILHDHRMSAAPVLLPVTEVRSEAVGDGTGDDGAEIDIGDDAAAAAGEAPTAGTTRTVAAETPEAREAVTIVRLSGSRPVSGRIIGLSGGGPDEIIRNVRLEPAPFRQPDREERPGQRPGALVRLEVTNPQTTGDTFTISGLGEGTSLIYYLLAESDDHQSPNVRQTHHLQAGPYIFVIDNSPPKINITAPAEPDITGSRFQLQGSTNGSSAEYSIDGKQTFASLPLTGPPADPTLPALSGQSGESNQQEIERSFSTTIELDEDAAAGYAVTVRVQDAHGNRQTDHVIINRLSHAPPPPPEEEEDYRPELNILLPRGDTVFDQTGWIGGVVSTPVGSRAVEFSLDGQSFQTGLQFSDRTHHQTFLFELPRLEPGRHTIHIRGVDRNGYVGRTQRFNLTIASGNMEIELHNVEGGIYNDASGNTENSPGPRALQGFQVPLGRRAEITGTVHNAERLDTLRFWINEGDPSTVRTRQAENDPLGRVFSATLPDDLAYGEHRLYLEALDAEGNISQKEIAFYALSPERPPLLGNTVTLNPGGPVGTIGLTQTVLQAEPILPPGFLGPNVTLLTFTRTNLLRSPGAAPGGMLAGRFAGRPVAEARFTGEENRQERNNLAGPLQGARPVEDLLELEISNNRLSLTPRAEGITETFHIEFTTIDGFVYTSPPYRAIIDTTPPELTINRPADGSYHNESVVITGTAQDSVGLAGLEYLIGPPAAFGGDATIENWVPITLTESGAETREEPAVETGQNGVDDPIVINEGRDGEEQPGTLNGQSFSVEVPMTGLDPGPQHIFVRATDTLGHTTTRRVPVNYDPHPPEFHFITPHSDDVINGLTSVISRLESLSPIAELTYSLDGETYEPLTPGRFFQHMVDFSIQETGGPEQNKGSGPNNVQEIDSETDAPADNDSETPNGQDAAAGNGAGGNDGDAPSNSSNPQPVFFRAVDQAGNLTEATPRPQVDLTADLPVVEIQIPNEGAVVTADFTISGMAFDDDGVEEIFWRIYPVSPAAVTDNNDPTEAGPEAADNSDSPDASEETDRQDSPDASEETDRQDEPAATAESENLEQETPFQPLPGDSNFSVDISLDQLTDNEHIIEVYAVDLYGLPGETVRRQIEVSLAEPVLTFDFPDQERVNQGLVTLSGTAFDGNTMESVQISLDNGTTFQTAAGTNNWAYTLDTEILGDGTYRVQITGTDRLGVESTIFGLLNIDNTPPVLEMSLPAEGDITAGNLQINGIVEDNHQVQNVLLEIEPINREETEGGITAELPTSRVIQELVDISELISGVYNVRLTAMDAAGNSTQISRNVTIQDQVESASVGLLFPVQGARKSGTVTAEGRVQSSTPISLAAVYVNDTLAGTTEINSRGYFQFPIPKTLLVKGENSLRVSIDADQETKVESNTRTFFHSPHGGEVQITSHQAGDFLSDRPWLEGVVHYRHPPEVRILEEQGEREARDLLRAKEVSRVWVSLDNGRSFEQGRGREEWRYRIETQEIPNGPLPVIVRAEFRDGSTTVTRALFTVDKNPPRITLLSPEEGVRLNTALTMFGKAEDEYGISSIEAALRPGGKSRYAVPEFIQGMYVDFHILGLTYFEAGLGLSFFDDNVKLQAQFGVGPEDDRFAGRYIGGKLLANIANIPFSAFFGPDWDWLSMNLAVGANFSYIMLYEPLQAGQGAEGVVLSGILGQLEFPRVHLSHLSALHTYSFYVEPQLWFIPSDVSPALIPKISFGTRIGLF